MHRMLWTISGMMIAGAVALIASHFDSDDPWFAVGVGVGIAAVTVFNMGWNAYRYRSIDETFEAGYRVGYRAGRRAPKIGLAVTHMHEYRSRRDAAPLPGRMVDALGRALDLDD